MAYNSSHTGAQIDSAVGAVIEKGKTWDGKQDALTGTAGQIVGFDADGTAQAQDDKAVMLGKKAGNETATIPFAQTWSAMCYGGGKFVLLSGDKRAVYSTDGVTWTKTTMPADAYWTSVCYGGGKFVAVGASPTPAYSTDGVTWTAPDGYVCMSGFYSVCYGDGKFVAIPAGTGKACYYSADGNTWTEATLPF